MENIQTMSDEVLRKIDIYVEESSYYTSIYVPIDTMPNRVEELKRLKYENDKQFFIDGKYVGGSNG